MRAALEVFSARGYVEASLEEVARGAGVTKSLLYRHFPSKESLYLELMRSQGDELLAAMRDADRAGKSSRERLEATVEAFFGFFVERPFSRRLLFGEATAEPAVAAAHSRVQGRPTALVVDVLRADESLLRGDPRRDVALELFGQLVVTGLNGLAAWWVEHPEVRREELVERTVQLLWPGLEELQQTVEQRPCGDGAPR